MREGGSRPDTNNYHCNYYYDYYYRYYYYNFCYYYYYIIIIIIVIIIVTHPLYESRMHWIPDPTPPPPRRTGMDYSDPLCNPVIPLYKFQVILCAPVIIS